MNINKFHEQGERMYKENIGPELRKLGLGIKLATAIGMAAGAVYLTFNPKIIADTFQEANEYRQLSIESRENYEDDMPDNYKLSKLEEIR